MTGFGHHVKRKTLAAGILAAFMVIFAAGCSSANGLDDNTAMTAGDRTISRGLYQWYLIQAYDEAYAMHADTDDLWKETIEGEKAETWIRDRAVFCSARHAAVFARAEEVGLEFTEDQQDEIEENLETYWNASGYEMYYKDFDVDEDAFRSVLEEEKMEELLFEKQKEQLKEEVTDEERLAYYEQHCAAIQYIAVPFPTTEDDSINADELNEDRAEPADTTPIYEELKEKAEAAGNLEALMDEVDANEAYRSLGCSVSKQEDGSCALFYDGVPGITDAFMEALKAAETDQVCTYEDQANQYWIIYVKKNISAVPGEYEQAADTITEQVVQEKFETSLDDLVSGFTVTENKSITRKQNIKELFD
ncbi:MAG: hypothetical protein ACI4CZ_04480 [Hominisplanchenecus sp.]